MIYLFGTKIYQYNIIYISRHTIMNIYNKRKKEIEQCHKKIKYEQKNIVTPR